MFYCPLCNGINKLSYYCSNCKALLRDGGRLDDYSDSYSPYEESNLTQFSRDAGNQIYCIHLFYCPKCHYDKRVAVKKITKPRKS